MFKQEIVIQLFEHLKKEELIAQISMDYPSKENHLTFRIDNVETIAFFDGTEIFNVDVALGSFGESGTKQKAELESLVEYLVNNEIKIKELTYKTESLGTVDLVELGAKSNTYQMNIKINIF